MKVFISSVTHMLKDERAALPAFLSLFNHEALLFEHFVAQNRSSREACIAGVNEADVYILLLGSKYGDSLDDSGLSPTHEEFARARHRGIPVLVFNKILDEPDEPAQAKFKSEVGDFVNGKFWRSFSNPLECNQAVGEALRALSSPGESARRTRPSGPISVPWLSEPADANPYAGGTTAGWSGPGQQSWIPAHVSNPVLELHLVADGDLPYRGASDLQRSADALGSQARQARFVGAEDPLLVGASNGVGWAIRPPSFERGHHGEPHSEKFRGFLVRPGSTTAFISLPTDDMGCLIDRQGLQDHLAVLFSNSFPHLAANDVAVAGGLVHADRVWEGDPRRLGNRNSGFMRSPGATIRVGAEFVVPRNALPNGFGDIGADLAIEMLQDLQSLR